MIFGSAPCQTRASGRSLAKDPSSAKGEGSAPLVRCALVAATLLWGCERDAATRSAGQAPYAEPARPTNAAPQSKPLTTNREPVSGGPSPTRDDANPSKDDHAPKPQSNTTAPTNRESPRGAPSSKPANAPDPVRDDASRKPTTEAACKSQCRGEWKVHGLTDRPSCNCRTADSGRRCKDSDQCEGECIAEEGKTEVTAPGTPPRGFFLGRCSEFVTAFGCHALLMGGTMKEGPQPLDKEPPTICID